MDPTIRNNNKIKLSNNNQKIYNGSSASKPCLLRVHYIKI